MPTFQQGIQHMGISGYSFWVGKESKKLKWRTLTGHEKLLVFKNINLPEMFPHLENVNEIQHLWRDLLEVHQLFSAKPESLTPQRVQEFEARAKAFVNKFVELYPAKHVTPYMHCMMMQVYDPAWCDCTIHAARFREIQRFDDERLFSIN